MSNILDLARELVRKLEEREVVEAVSCDECVENTGLVELSTLSAGDTFKIGEHDFIVLEQCEDQTKVISKNFMLEDVKFDEDFRDYNSSNLKNRIESDILPIIEKECGEDFIIEHEVDLTSVDMQNEFEPCKCKVRPITFDEARKYNDLLVNDDLDGYWWTCTPWSTEERGYRYSIAVVSPSGDFGDCGCSYDWGVRPFCILKSNIFVSKGEN